MDSCTKDEAILRRAQATFELYRTAKVLMRQNLRNRFPEECEEDIERRLRSWLRKEPSERWGGATPPSYAFHPPLTSVTPNS